MRSLRVRLLLIGTLVLAGSLIAGSLLVRRVSRHELERFVTLESVDLDRSVVPALNAYAKAHADWTGVDSVLATMHVSGGRLPILIDSTGRPHAPRALGLQEGDATILPDGTLRLTLHFPNGDRRRGAILLRGGWKVGGSAGAPVGRLYFAPGPEPALPTDAERRFGTSLDRALVYTVPLVGVVAATALVLLARRVLGPIDDLTAAVRRMAAGHRDARVEVRSNDEIGELARSFNGMAESLERLEKQRRDLIGDIAHELRTPLTNARCQIEALEDGLVAPDRAALASLHEDIVLLSRLVADLQEMALFEAGQLRLRVEVLSLEAEVGRVLAALKARAEAAGVTIESLVIGEMPAVRADPERFAQVLRNLVHNAIDHSPREGSVIVQAKAIGQFVEISVRDRGDGIAAEHLPHVFERFYRADPSRTRSTGGAGLGLAIVRQLVETHGGEVHVESLPGSGATFFFTLPIATPGAS